MATAKRSTHSSSRRTSASKRSTSARTTTARRKTTRKRPSSSQRCWPGFEPTPGKAAGEEGSCKPKKAPQSKAVRHADQRAAAASKLQKTRPRHK